MEIWNPAFERRLHGLLGAGTARFCRLLEERGLWYDVSDADRRADDARLRGGLGQRPESVRLHRIYVKNADAGLARYLMQNARRRADWPGKDGL